MHGFWSLSGGRYTFEGLLFCEVGCSTVMTTLHQSALILARLNLLLGKYRQ